MLTPCLRVKIFIFGSDGKVHKETPIFMDRILYEDGYQDFSGWKELATCCGTLQNVLSNL
jgi:hypothetical protein